MPKLTPFFVTVRIPYVTYINEKQKDEIEARLKFELFEKIREYSVENHAIQFVFSKVWIEETYIDKNRWVKSGNMVCRITCDMEVF